MGARFGVVVKSFGFGNQFPGVQRRCSWLLFYSSVLVQGFVYVSSLLFSLSRVDVFKVWGE